MGSLKNAKGVLMITPELIHEIRGRLMVKERRDIKWLEFSEITGIPVDTLASLRVGRRRGSPITINRLLSVRERGIMIDVDDFLVEP